MIVVGLTGCEKSSDSASANAESQQNQPAEESKVDTVIEDREGFSIREISDDLFGRMVAGNIYKSDRKDYRHFELPSEITDKYSEMYAK